MTSRDFCYWLQGYFEIGGTEISDTLCAPQIEIIKKHLALVFKAQIDSSRNPDATVGNDFCHFLDGFLQGADCRNGLAQAHVSTIKSKLNDIFIHKIDPTFANRDELSAIHNHDRESFRRDDGRPRIEVLC